MVDAGADKRQANSNVHAFFNTKVFYGDKPLIMILCDHNVVMPLARLHKYRITWPGAAGVDALLLCRFNGRGNYGDFFIAKLAIFPCVWVEPGDCNAWLLNSRLLAGELSKFNRT